ncbi:putative armadillo-like helical, importin beta family [Helianthus annuus]|uniref:Armadillo-like helical, importin beta family n=1 Tax=Helianthus annuus TaxID=4232 RepID=A0A9K3HB57_HELAN|nr:putative armadillo-like helical, importin beta family [Helianthus annuus]KAJ0848283.1 putative armadillo-like helical, importin beta family [Helianthus annuus]
MCNALVDQEDHSKRKNFLIKYVGDCLGTLLMTFKAPFLPLFDELLPYLMPMWGKDRTDEEKRIAICIFDDVAEHCGDAAVKLLFTGLACVQSMVELHSDHMLAALSRLDVVIRRPDALHPDNVMAYDNAVSALGKIWQVHRDSINVAQVVPAWLNCLPIKGDLIEAKVVHDQLCSMVERSDGELLGLNHQYLPKIVGVFADVLSAGKDLASEETATRMINLLRQLQQTLPPSAMASTLSSLQPQQLALQSVLSS